MNFCSFFHYTTRSERLVPIKLIVHIHSASKQNWRPTSFLSLSCMQAASYLVVTVIPASVTSPTWSARYMLRDCSLSLLLLYSISRTLTVWRYFFVNHQVFLPGETSKRRDNCPNHDVARAMLKKWRRDETQQSFLLSCKSQSLNYVSTAVQYVFPLSLSSFSYKIFYGWALSVS